MLTKFNVMQAIRWCSNRSSKSLATPNLPWPQSKQCSFCQFFCCAQVSCPPPLFFSSPLPYRRIITMFSRWTERDRQQLLLRCVVRSRSSSSCRNWMDSRVFAAEFVCMFIVYVKVWYIFVIVSMSDVAHAPTDARCGVEWRNRL